MKNFSYFLFLSLFLSACGSNKTVTIQGAGASFPAPIYNKVFGQYTAEKKIPVIYQAVGSGAGIQNIVTGIVDFGATDAFLSDAEIAKYTNTFLHIPAVLAAVNFTYNLVGFDESNPLSLDAETIYQIYAGEITTWNDAKIQVLNPEAQLPSTVITPIYRSDSSGTTFIMSEFMTKASQNWANTFGTAKTINWIAGVGQKGNSSVMGFAKENEGSIAYVDLVYAKQNNFPVAKIKNKAGNFVLGDIANASEAANNIVIPTDTRVSLTDAEGMNSAPMTTFSYLLVRQEQNYNNRTLLQAQELVKLLQWMYTAEAQDQHAELYFSPMPPYVLELGQNIINQINYDGKPVVETL